MNSTPTLVCVIVLWAASAFAADAPNPIPPPSAVKIPKTAAEIQQRITTVEAAIAAQDKATEALDQRIDAALSNAKLKHDASTSWTTLADQYQRSATEASARIDARNEALGNDAGAEDIRAAAQQLNEIKHYNLLLEPSSDLSIFKLWTNEVDLLTKEVAAQRKLSDASDARAKFETAAQEIIDGKNDEDTATLRLAELNAKESSRMAAQYQADADAYEFAAQKISAERLDALKNSFPMRLELINLRANYLPTLDRESKDREVAEKKAAAQKKAHDDQVLKAQQAAEAAANQRAQIDQIHQIMNPPPTLPPQIPPMPPPDIRPPVFTPPPPPPTPVVIPSRP